ncbi:hypothetical protein FLA_4237 [Filimonas lacunae]|nr:hypothetical protein FLA_4237 [Filimonas lacunae]
MTFYVNLILKTGEFFFVNRTFLNGVSDNGIGTISMLLRKKRKREKKQ